MAAFESASRYHAAVGTPALFEARGLAVAVGGRRLLSGLDLRASGRGVLAIQGPSGLGKTTLLRTLAGLLDPEEGELLLEGRPPLEIGYPAYRRRVVYLAQRPVLFDGTVLDNLRMPFGYATSGGATLDEARSQARLERMRLGDALAADAMTLSEGQKQRVALTRALAVAPQVLLLDEPTSALDPESRGALERCLLDYLDDCEAAAIVVSHDADQLERLDAQVIDLATYADAERADG